MTDETIPRAHRINPLILITVWAICVVLLFAFPPLGFILWIVFIVGIAIRYKGQSRVVVQDTNDSTPVDDEDNQEHFSHSYEIPSICPNCGRKLGLNEIRWIDSEAGLCPYCESFIQSS